MGSRLQSIVKVVDLEMLRRQLASLENDAAADNLWDDTAKANALLSQIAGLKAEVRHGRVADSAGAERRARARALSDVSDVFLGSHRRWRRTWRLLAAHRSHSLCDVVLPE